MRAEAAELKIKARRRSLSQSRSALQLEELRVMMQRLKSRAGAAVLIAQDCCLSF